MQYIGNEYTIIRNRKVYADRQGEERTGEAEIRQARTPAPLLQHSYASASVVADVIVKKYTDALPLYRQEQIWKRQGLPIKRGSMANWIILTGRQYLQPIWHRLHEKLLIQRIIHADETVCRSTRSREVRQAKNRGSGPMPLPSVRRSKFACSVMKAAGRTPVPGNFCGGWLGGYDI